jgi:prepilin-type processing-associated H-X9-DG protein
LESLVVVSVIALLIVILTPTLSKARAQARSVKCLSNLHQLQAGALVYASQNRGYLPAASEPGQTAWATHLARQVGLRFSGPVAPVDRSGVFQCPQRESGQPGPFLGYVANAMNPRGPAPDGAWVKASSLRSDAYKRPSGTIYLADAEREDMVVHIAGHPGGDTVKDAHDNWRQGLLSRPTIGAMTVWTGSHLPEGKDCVNVTEEPGVRRVARKLHMSRFTNAGFIDGHAAGLPPGGWPLDENNYGVWLQRFGVRDVDAARAAPIQ